ncbi:zinc finger MYND domain-containing protein 11-like protein [Dinothrombium tinctorium]|uniref:Zinc finger MYND domain-containing protein 11-like protein n=1 Tax=Dinothrombium tinctorium TaxID=1965070 RepID=A0A3S4QSU3_9ACAR|nr:zinc finger MYND domain-containing protein 11-like protein [Dinothrombium tinctorium]
MMAKENEQSSKNVSKCDEMSACGEQSITRRRAACPQTVQQLWDVIANVIRLKQPPNLEKIQAHMYKKYQIGSNECERHLQSAVNDRLVVKSNDVYSMPDENTILEDDGSDWYCFECHRPGDVLLCSSCWRVYHKCCPKDISFDDQNFVCFVCRQIANEKEACVGNKCVSLTELNTLLSYTYNRLMDKGRESLSNLQLTESDRLKHKFLLYMKVDLNDIQHKTREIKYKKLAEFEADCRSVVHCVNVIFGQRTAIAELAEQMLSDCIYDLNEIRQCSDCYKMSNETPGKYWFSTPCNPPHELVFAKQKGFPFWPAKVIKVDNGVYDVRFFGSFHERALVEKDCIRPITTSTTELKITKKSAQLARAFDELKKHQRLLEEMKQNEMDAIDSRSKKRGRGRISNSHKEPATKKRKTVRKTTQPKKRGRKKVLPRKKSPIFKSNLTPIKEETSFEAIEDNLVTEEESNQLSNESTIKNPTATENGVATNEVAEHCESPAKRRGGRQKGKAKSSLAKGSVNSNKNNIFTQTNKELLKPFYEDKKDVSPTTTAALIDAEVLTATDKSNEEKHFSSNGIETSAETESISSQESQESTLSLSKSRPARSLKPNSLIFTAGIQPISPHKHKKRGRLNINSNQKLPRTPKTPKLRVYGRRGRPPKIRDNLEPSVTIVNQVEHSKSSPLLSSLLNNTLHVPSYMTSPTTRTGKPKGRPRKYPLPSPAASILNISKRISENLLPPPPPPGTSCDCDEKYRKHFQNLEETLTTQHMLQLQKLTKELEEKDKEKLRLQIRLSAVQTENELLRSKNMSVANEMMLKKQIEEMREQHKQEISSIKRKQWVSESQNYSAHSATFFFIQCANCEKEAIYFCCWNTSYCSLECQQHDWHAEHKRNCRRVKH